MTERDFDESAGAILMAVAGGEIADTEDVKNVFDGVDDYNACVRLSDALMAIGVISKDTGEWMKDRCLKYCDERERIMA